MNNAILFLSVIASIGLVVAAFGTITVARAYRSRTWPSVMGSIQASKLALATRDNDGSSYKPLITYTYTVNGTEFSNDLIGYGLGYYTGSREFAERYVAKYPAGHSVKIFYRASAPGDSVLEPGISPVSFIPMSFGLLFAAAGVGGVLLVLHQEAVKALG